MLLEQKWHVVICLIFYLNIYTPTIVEDGDTILSEDTKKVVSPLLAIADHNSLSFPESDELIPDGFNDEIITYVNELSAEPMTGTSTSCRGACTGLCLGSCRGGCGGGCIDMCSETCTGGCKANCGTGCAGGSMSNT